MPNVVLIGPPGCGKGTQAARVSVAHALHHVSSGELLRRAVRDGSELGLSVGGTLAAGNLVSDGLMLGLMREILGDLKAAGRGWLLDGFPRTVPQSEGLVELIAELEIAEPAVVHIVVPENEIVARLSGRLTCAEGSHVIAKGEAVAGGPCPVCGAPLTVRADDTPETVRNRLRVYREKTEACARVLESVYGLRAVNGTGSPDEVTERIEGVLASND